MAWQGGVKRRGRVAGRHETAWQGSRAARNGMAGQQGDMKWHGRVAGWREMAQQGGRVA